jgi:ABC-type branched-subunit amino acid transport system substrate-binding protein
MTHDDERGAHPAPEDQRTFGQRFLDEYKRLGGSLTAWSYAEIQALKAADREGLARTLKEAQPLISYAALQRIRTVETPEQLARDVRQQQQVEAAAVGSMGMFAMFAMLMAIR